MKKLTAFILILMALLWGYARESVYRPARAQVIGAKFMVE